MISESIKYYALRFNKNNPSIIPEERHDFQSILARKRLPTDPFVDSNLIITLDDSLINHVAWVYERFYRHIYPKGCGSELRMPRLYHGLQHVSRVALYVPIFCNLYRKYGEPEALQLSNEDLKLLQIAALFHDCAREGDGEDLWDQDSALFLYYYLVKTLKVDPIKAKLIAEAVANKDCQIKKKYCEIVDQDGVISIRTLTTQNVVKNIYQKIIHDADCLDIIRARSCFSATFLDFYDDICKVNDAAFEELAYLITEARSLIITTGDCYLNLNYEKKLPFECKDGYEHLLATVNSEPNSILAKLSIGLLEKETLESMQLVKPLTYSSDSELSEENMHAALLTGRVLARSIIGSSSAARRIGTPKKNDNETVAEIELRKIMRRLNVPTRTNKNNRYLKEGNPCRSTSLLGFGGGVISNVGFLIVDPTDKALVHVGTIDIDTGLGKQAGKEKRIKAIKMKEQSPQTLPMLFHKLKMGGVAREWTLDGGRRLVGYHTEVVYNVNQYDAIYFSLDKLPLVFIEDDMNKDFALLEAIYLQKQHQIQYDNLGMQLTNLPTTCSV